MRTLEVDELDEDFDAWINQIRNSYPETWRDHLLCYSIIYVALMYELFKLYYALF